MGPAEPNRLLAGRYRLRSIIGRGGMGVVWRARDELLGRDVAVKEILWPPQMDTAERDIARRRALREAQMAARLSHPNVVGVFDIVEEDGRPWIVMELLPYRSLRDAVLQDGPLSPERAAQVGLGVLAALRAAHDVGVLHRDVKPANVLIAPEGRVVLTDFGIARANDSPALTTSGVLVGSPSYISPERARGERAAAAGDMWALGACLYAAVEGRPPFDRDGVLASLTAVVTDEPDPPARAGPLWPVISGLLRKEPGARLSAHDVEQMLRHLAENVAPDEANLGGEVSSPAEDVPPNEAGPTAEVSSPAEDAARNEAGPMAEVSFPEENARPDEADPPVETGLPELETGLPELETGLPDGAVPSTGAAPPAEPGAPTGADPPAESPPRTGPIPAAAATHPGEPIPQPAAGPSVRAGAAAPGNTPPGHARRLRVALAALAAAVVIGLVVAGIVLTTPSSPRHQTASQSATASATPKASATRPAPSAPASPAPSDSPGGASVMPAGYYRFTNSTGFSIGIPTGWQISHVGHYVYIRDPANSGIFLLIDQSDQPQPNALQDWEQQASARQSSYPGYHLIRLQAVHYAQAEQAADWEFTYDRSGIPVHILNRNILANADHAYALYWSAPESDWSGNYHYFQAFAATFQPAGASQGG